MPLPVEAGEEMHVGDGEKQRVVALCNGTVKLCNFRFFELLNQIKMTGNFNFERHYICTK